MAETPAAAAAAGPTPRRPLLVVFDINGTLSARITKKERRFCRSHPNWPPLVQPALVSAPAATASTAAHVTQTAQDLAAASAPHASAAAWRTPPSPTPLPLPKRPRGLQAADGARPAPTVAAAQHGGAVHAPEVRERRTTGCPTAPLRMDGAATSGETAVDAPFIPGSPTASLHIARSLFFLRPYVRESVAAILDVADVVIWTSMHTHNARDAAQAILGDAIISRCLGVLSAQDCPDYREDPMPAGNWQRPLNVAAHAPSTADTNTEAEADATADVTVDTTVGTEMGAYAKREVGAGAEIAIEIEPEAELKGITQPELPTPEAPRWRRRDLALRTTDGASADAPGHRVSAPRVVSGEAVLDKDAAVDADARAGRWPSSSRGRGSLKDLRAVWRRWPQYDATNTILVDDSLHKTLAQPGNALILPSFGFELLDVNPWRDRALPNVVQYIRYLSERLGCGSATGSADASAMRPDVRRLLTDRPIVRSTRLLRWGQDCQGMKVVAQWAVHPQFYSPVDAADPVPAPRSALGPRIVHAPSAPRPSKAHAGASGPTPETPHPASRRRPEAASASRPASVSHAETKAKAKTKYQPPRQARRDARRAGHGLQGGAPSRPPEDGGRGAGRAGPAASAFRNGAETAA
ncbi:hypothetical protein CAUPRSCDRAFT_11090 [Caulochytrium protostelioides]|nr:hypothetical protein CAUPRSCDRAFT_11090 [Caulochytrium protostelioides]